MLGKPSRRTRRKLEEHGISAPAIVVEIADGGMAVTNGSEGVVSNTELIVKTKLRVEPAGQPSFEVHQRFRYPQLAIPSVGSRLTVRYDPDDHDSLMIDRSAAATLSTPAGLPGGQTLGDVLATVRQAQATGGGDRMAMAEQLRSSFGGQALVLDGRATGPTAEVDTIAALERLVALRDAGALSADEFDAQKRRLLP